MKTLDLKSNDERSLPDKIDFYFIKSDGKVTSSNDISADVYISEFDVTWFSDKEAMLHIRETYGPRVGVMRDIDCNIQSRVYRTPKVLLGVVKSQQK